MGTAWEGEGSLLVVVSTLFARGGLRGPVLELICVNSGSRRAPGWLPSRGWFFSSCGSHSRGLKWPLRPGSEPRGPLSCPLTSSEGRTPLSPPAPCWPFPVVV